MDQTLPFPFTVENAENIERGAEPLDCSRNERVATTGDSRARSGDEFCARGGSGLPCGRAGRRKSRGFSLIEVVLAVGVCAGAVVTVLALLPMLARDAADAADLRAAQQMSGALNVELRRIAAVRGFDAFAGVVPVLSAPPAEGFTLVGARDGVSVKAEDEVAGDPRPEDQYFLIEVYRFSQPSLAYVPGGGVLPLHVRVSWPFRVRGAGTVTPRQERRSCGFTLAIHR